MTSPSTNSHRWIAHVDLDAFFASCEQRDHPAYRGQPVIVGALPGNRGVVAACSYEARTFGIHSAMPIVEAHRRCPDAIYLRPNMPKYQQASQQVFQVLTDITPAVEKASIDEAYLDISGLEKLSGAPDIIGRKIRQKIYDATQLTASIGIGPNRLIAKLGSEVCKPDGLIIVPPEQVLDFLAPMPITNLRGLGRQTQKIFKRLHIHTVAELRATSLTELREHLGDKAAASFHRQALGHGSDEIITDRRRKSISKEHTFGTDVQDPDVLHDTLRELAAEVARTARRESLAGGVVTLKIRFKGFDTHTRQHTLETPTNDERVMLTTAWSLFKHSDFSNKPVRLIGVGIRKWGAQQTAQTDLFEPIRQKNQDQEILNTIDAVTKKFGKPLLGVGLTRKK